MPKRKAITEGLALVFQGIEHLKTAFPHRRSRSTVAWLATSAKSSLNSNTTSSSTKSLNQITTAIQRMAGMFRSRRRSRTVLHSRQHPTTILASSSIPTVVTRKSSMAQAGLFRNGLLTEVELAQRFSRCPLQNYESFQSRCLPMSVFQNERANPVVNRTCAKSHACRLLLR